MRVSKTLIENSEELLIIISRWKLKQMVPIGILTYKKSTKEGIIYLIFTILLLLERFISCDIEEKFGHDLDHKPILS